MPFMADILLEAIKDAKLVVVEYPHTTSSTVTVANVASPEQMLTHALRAGTATLSQVHALQPVEKACTAHPTTTSWEL